MNQSIKYLITGSHGFLGKVLVAGLRKSATKVFTLGRSINSDLVQDITQPFIFPKDSLDINVVIHAAGKAHSLPKNNLDKREFYDTNLEGTKNLCSAITSLPVLPKAFIFISTVAVYGKDEGEMISETHPLNGRSPYAESKIMAEEYLTKWAKEHKIILTILRLPLIAGPDAPGNLSAMIQGIRTGRYLAIGQSKIRKSMVWAEDIVNILPKLVLLGGIYNLTDGYHPSFKELEACISLSFNKRKPIRIPYFLAKVLAFTGDIIGKRAPINSDKLKRIISTLTFDDSKASKELDWNPSSVVEMLPSILKGNMNKGEPFVINSNDFSLKQYILISGINGFVGSNLSTYLKNFLHEIRGVSRHPPNYISENQDLTWEQTKNLKAYPFNVIIHLAGLAHDLTNSIDEESYFKINRDLTISLYDSFLKSEAETFIFLSSVKAVTDHTSCILKETDIPNPQSIYGKSKRQAEEYLISQPLPPGKRLFIFRPCMIHGPGNKGNLNLLYKFVSYGIPYPLAAFKNKRSFLSINNLCYIVNQVMIDSTIPSGIYNLADDEVLSTNEVVKLISNILRKKPRLITLPKPLLRLLGRIGDQLNIPLNSDSLKKLTEDYVVSNEKIKKALKIDSLQCTSQEGLETTIQSFLNQKL